MRRIALAATLAAAVVVVPAAPALAHPNTPLAPTLPTDVTFSATDNVEYLGRFPEHTGTAGGFPSEDGQHFFVTDPRGVFAYDTTDPASPTRVGSLALPQGGLSAALSQEDPDSNGEILLVDATMPPDRTSQLRVVDISDPTNLKVLGSVPVTDHTWTCVTATVGGEQNTCAYAYGRTGHIVDLTDPANPKKLTETWRSSVDYGSNSNSPYTHDLTEIRPGLVMTAGASAVLMSTTDPTAPERIAELGDTKRFSSLGYHSVEWADGGENDVIVLGTEIAPGAAPGLPGNTAGSDCKGPESVIETWDASAFANRMKAYAQTGDVQVFEGAEFTKIDEYDASGRGIFLEGKALASQLYCAHWMELHPDFADGGLMAVSYYNRGTRFVEIGADGTMTEVGWITPTEGYSGSPQWIGVEEDGDSIVYISDYKRGLEVVRLKAEEATGVVRNAPDVIAAGSSFDVPPLHLHTGQLALGAFALLLVALFGVERLARRRAVAAA
jgi:hypothetical protein